MKNETKIWLNYARENLESSKVLLDNNLYNPCLQNIQQAVEKALKAIFIEKAINLKRTHDLLEIKYILQKNNIEIDISDDDCDFLNSIYLPSKYPVVSVLAEYDPDEEVCQDAINIAERVLESVSQFLA